MDHGERDVEEVWRAKTAFPDQLLSSPGVMACCVIKMNVSLSLDLLLFLTIVNQRIQTIPSIQVCRVEVFPILGDLSPVPQVVTLPASQPTLATPVVDSARVGTKKIKIKIKKKKLKIKIK